jgi:hypothetical protein
MTERSDERMVRLLRNALPIVQQPAGSDVWPRVRDRVERGAPAPAVGDWLLAIAAVALCLIKPASLSLVLFHL